MNVCGLREKSNDNDIVVEDSQTDNKVELFSDTSEADVRANAPRLHGRTLTAALTFVAGTGFKLFGFVFNLAQLVAILKEYRLAMIKASCLPY